MSLAQSFIKSLIKKVEIVKEVCSVSLKEFEMHKFFAPYHSGKNAIKSVASSMVEPSVRISSMEEELDKLATFFSKKDDWNAEFFKRAFGKTLGRDLSYQNEKIRASKE